METMENGQDEISAKKRLGKNKIKKFEKKRRWSRGVGIFFLVLVAIVVSLGFFKKRVYEPKIGVNLVLVSEKQVVLVGIRGGEDRLIWVELPKKLRVKVADSEAVFPVVSLWEFGKIEKRPVEIVSKSLAVSFGVILSGVNKTSGEITMEKFLSSLISLKTKSSLGWWDRYVLYKDVARILSKGSVLEIKLPWTVMNEVVDADGKVWQELNEAVFVWSRDLWPSEVVLGLGLTAGVYNASEVLGKARGVSRQLESVGFRVVEVAVASEKIKKKGCWYDWQEEKKEVLWLLERHLWCKARGGILEKGEAKADVVVWMGE